MSKTSPATMQRIIQRVFFMVLLLAGASSALQAQGFRDRLKAKIKERLQARAYTVAVTAVDAGVAKTAEVVRCVVGDKKCAQKAADAGKTVVVTDPKGEPLPAAALPAAALQSTPNASGCNDDLIMKTGSWKKGEDSNWKHHADDPGTETDRVQMFAHIDQFAQLLRAAYPEPKGIGASWMRWRGDTPLVKGGPFPYELTGMFKVYYCNKNIPGSPLELGDETGTWAYVWANQLSWFVEGVTFFVVGKNGDRVFFLTKQVGEFKGYPLYEGIHNSKSYGTTYSRAIMITRPGQSPYAPVTKRQFLRAYVLHNEKKKAEGLAVMATITGPQREENSRRVAKGFDDDMQPAKDLLSKLSEDELKQPAIIDKGEFGGDFKAFTTEEKGGRMLMHLNSAYFDATLPRSVPQLLIVYWRWDKGKPGENFKDHFEANFDVAALQRMIDH